MASHSTRDHDEIRRWAEQHQAAPSVVSRTGGMLRFEFSDAAGALEEIDWEDFFRVFDEKGLELIYDDKPGSRFHKFAYPETVAAKSEGRKKAAASTSAGGRRPAHARVNLPAKGARGATPIAKGRSKTTAPTRAKAGSKAAGRGHGKKAA